MELQEWGLFCGTTGVRLCGTIGKGLCGTQRNASLKTLSTPLLHTFMYVIQNSTVSAQHDRYGGLETCSDKRQMSTSEARQAGKTGEFLTVLLHW